MLTLSMWSFPDHDFSKIKHCTSEHSSINSQHFWYIYAYVNEQNHKPRLSKSSYIWEEWVGCCICPPVTEREISQDLPELLMSLLLPELWDWRRYSSWQGLLQLCCSFLLICILISNWSGKREDNFDSIAWFTSSPPFYILEKNHFMYKCLQG